mgnify:FL=1
MINSVGASSKGEKAFPLTAICGGALSAHPLCVALTQKLRWPASFFRGTVGEALNLPSANKRRSVAQFLHSKDNH